MKKPKISGVTREIKIKRCYGCGAILQSSDKKGAGYIDKERLESNEDLLCQRCYRLRHYNEDNQIPHFNEDFNKILIKAKEKDSLIVLVLDTFSLNGSLEEGLIKSMNELKITNIFVLLNKRDVLPKSYSDEKIINHTLDTLAVCGIKPLDMLLVSSVKNYNLDTMMARIEELRKGNDVYFVGVSQVGKSSIINSLLKNYQNKTDKFITTSLYPGTTIDVIKIPLDRNSYIYDTAGIFNAKSMINNVERSILKHIIPRSEISPRVYQLNEEQSLLLGAIARVDYLKGPKGKTSFTFICSNNIKIERVKLSNANKTFSSLVITKQTTPVSSMIQDLKDLHVTHLHMPDSGNVAISIAGLAVIVLDACGQDIDIYAPEKVMISIGKNPWY